MSDDSTLTYEELIEGNLDGGDDAGRERTVGAVAPASQPVHKPPVAVPPRRPVLPPAAIGTEFQELVVDRRTGQPRQAGADQSEGQFVLQFRRRAERSLYVFAKGVLGLDRLTPSLHKPTCDWLLRTPPYRKLLLMPRDHLKTSMMRALTLHLIVQPEGGLYTPEIAGKNIRILYAGETSTNAEHQLRWIAGRLESNKRLRALWPHVCWDNPRRDSKKWNEKEVQVPRDPDVDFPEATIETIGVGGAITGRHYNVMIKDDLISLEAANSAVVMHGAIEWHNASRALLDNPDKSLEWIIGTRWAVYDLYDVIIKNDPSVEVLIRSAIEHGYPIFPEMFSLGTLDQLRRELTVLFPPLYLNTAVHASISDFTVDDVRKYVLRGDALVFDEDDRDITLREQVQAPVAAPNQAVGMRLNTDTYDLIFGRNEFIRLKRG